MIEAREENQSATEGVAFALVSKGKILLEKRMISSKSLFGNVIIPGGTIERNENKEEALIREATEEANVFPTRYERLGTFNWFDDGVPTTTHLYLVLGWEGVLNEGSTKDGHHQFLAPLKLARKVCKHELTQLFLDVIESHLKANEEERLPD